MPASNSATSHVAQAPQHLRARHAGVETWHFRLGDWPRVFQSWLLGGAFATPLHVLKPGDARVQDVTSVVDHVAHQAQMTANYLEGMTFHIL